VFILRCQVLLSLEPANKQEQPGIDIINREIPQYTKILLFHNTFINYEHFGSYIYNDEPTYYFVWNKPYI